MFSRLFLEFRTLLNMIFKDLTPKQTSDQNNKECHMAPTSLDAIIFLKSIFCIINNIQ